jgi:hypothetical protein
MAKGEQRSNKQVKKPKKDSGEPTKTVSSDRPVPPVTSVLPRGKLAKKLGG